MTRYMTRIVLLSVAVGLSWTAPAQQEAPVPNKAQRLVFMDDHLRDVDKGSVLNYDFSSQTKDEQKLTDTVRVTVTDVLDDGTRNLEFDFLSGKNHIDFEPAVGYVGGNPVVIHVLEWDISRMVRATGGSNNYLRNAIRRSFKQPEVESTEIAFQGDKVPATRVVVRPFVNDPNIDRFPVYANKSYEFIFSDRVPGSVYRIHTLVPGDKAGEIYIEEQLTFSRVTPAG